MKCPSFEEVEINKDNQLRLAIWYRFVDTVTYEDSVVMNHLCEYFKGFTPELSKAVGWDENEWF